MAQLLNDEKKQQMNSEKESNVKNQIVEEIIIIPNYNVVKKKPPSISHEEWLNCKIFMQYMFRFDIIRDFIQYRYANLGMIIDGYNYNASVNRKSIINYLKQYNLDLIWYSIVNNSILTANNKWKKCFIPTQTQKFWFSIFQILKDRIDVKKAAIEKELSLYEQNDKDENNNDVIETHMLQGYFQFFENKIKKEV